MCVPPKNQPRKAVAMIRYLPVRLSEGPWLSSVVGAMDTLSLVDGQ
jgi:hypothetical protein